MLVSNPRPETNMKTTHIFFKCFQQVGLLLSQRLLLPKEANLSATTRQPKQFGRYLGEASSLYGMSMSTTLQLPRSVLSLGGKQETTSGKSRNVSHCDLGEIRSEHVSKIDRLGGQDSVQAKGVRLLAQNHWAASPTVHSKMPNNPYQTRL